MLRITHGIGKENHLNDANEEKKENTIGRLYTIHPKQDECFFLRMLLVNVPGPMSFQQLKIVNGVTHAT